jgi:hypothetical protein
LSSYKNQLLLRACNDHQLCVVAALGAAAVIATWVVLLRLRSSGSAVAVHDGHAKINMSRQIQCKREFVRDVKTTS